MNKKELDFRLIAEWKYSIKEWNEFVVIEKENKKEDSVYFGIGILTLGTVMLMILRKTNLLTGVLFTISFAILIPWLRFKFSYKHLKKGVKNPSVKIYSDHLLINSHKIKLYGNKKRVKSLKIIKSKNNLNLLEFDVQWITSKGPINDEFRILIPNDKMIEAEKIIATF
ncbi:hypothetical protein [Polaribacter ponticola]|uniref:YcxB family protein n=1 Tax=Polaribacter ponticola TaxID=2978475 RepID=A0ABT5SCJ8_9FLAO|nr:hypothetical protein [Polaribacter sp. MSW5]MDD7915849.1 hypothetical protein [Polaribacter sp. MSW5]